MLLINNETVEEILDMKGCIDALETGYRDLLAQRAVYRPRIDLYVPQDDPERMYRWGTMEGASRSFGVFAIRMKSDMLEWPEGRTVEKYCMEPGTYCGLVMVFSARNAEPLAIINDGIIQHMRVGACAGLAARYLARDDAARWWACSAPAAWRKPIYGHSPRSGSSGKSRSTVPLRPTGRPTRAR